MFVFEFASLRTICMTFAGLVIVSGALLILRSHETKARFAASPLVLKQISKADLDLGFSMGIILILLGLIGLFGLVAYNDLLLLIYEIALLLVAIIFFIGASFVFTHSEEQSRLMTQFDGAIRVLLPSELNDLQRTYKCCGIEKYTDYLFIWKQWGFTEQNLKQKVKPLDQLTPDKGPYFKKRPHHPPHYLTTSSSPTGVRRKREMIFTENPIGVNHRKRDKRSAGDTSDVPRACCKSFEEFSASLNDSDIIEKFKKKYLDERFKDSWVINVYDQNYTVRWLYNLYLYMAETMDFIQHAPDSYLLWWWGSGWDDILFHESVKVKSLPQTCCRHKQKSCIGNKTDTFTDGCAYHVKRYFRLGIREIALLMFCLIPSLFITIFTMHVYRDSETGKTFF